MVINYTVQEAERGRTVYSILRHALCLSAGLIRRLKQADAICIGGQAVWTNHIAQPGDLLELDISTVEPPCDVVPEIGDLRILYEDAGLLAACKLPGILTHPSRARYTGTLANHVAGYLEHTTGDGRCHAVNRLDRDTSGVVLFAKNSYMKARAAEALGAPETVKTYLALVCGMMAEPSGTIDHPIRRLCEGDMRRVTAPDGQRAVTHYETLKTKTSGDAAVSLLRLRLETGRTHQIRVHCLAIGHPVMGDRLYFTEASKNVSEQLGIETQALHAHRLRFTEPLSGKALDLTAPLPSIFATIFSDENIY
ncbi:RluA family pseudouridine synthase [Oscillospiraceae bacterium WX1]